jgi:hypothetical protein
MRPIQFETIVGADRIIRPPAGVSLPEGVIEVTVRPLPSAPAVECTPSVSAHGWLLELAAEAERVAPKLPSDLAEHHDHYAHGKPLP